MFVKSCVVFSIVFWFKFCKDLYNVVEIGNKFCTDLYSLGTLLCFVNLCTISSSLVE